MNNEQANEALQTVKKILDEAGIFFFLAFGTLLGAVREQDFILYDDDVDVGVLGKDIAKVYDLRPKFKELDYYMCTLTVKDRFSQLYIARPERPKVDIYSFVPCKGHISFLKYFNYPKRPDRTYFGPTIVDLPYPKKYFEEWRTIHFKGADYNIHKEAEAFLEYIWGDWWNIHGGQWGRLDNFVYPAQEFEYEE